ncbi:glycosyltransferase [Adlercreutzia caecimuris]|uniref:glycosyltransferase n=1 Tax=Adlercreutzia caecimuris TaxID=671266 RepID=UPI00272B6D8E|nr:glycosyltransferase [Adlercreutzia caecimuris]
MRRKLYLFTNAFPYGKVEKPFVGPELDALAQKYDVTIVSHASRKEIEEREWTSRVPLGVSVLRYDQPSRVALYGRVLSFFFLPTAWKELGDLFRDGFSWGRLRELWAVFAHAASKRCFYQKAGVFNDVESSLYYSFWFNDQNLALAMEKKEKPDLKLVSRIHGYDLYNERSAMGRQPFQRYKKHQTNKIIFLTKAAKNYFEENFGPLGQKEKSAIVALGTRAARRLPRRVDSQPLTVVSCSSLIPIKRVELIAEAISSLESLSVRWVHFGDGENRDSLLAYCDAHNVPLSLRGHVDNADIYAYYQDNYVDAFITTSASEGSPVSIQEALSFGIPVIGTDVGGISEQIDGNGILLPANPTAAEVANSLELILGCSPEEKERMRLRSQEIWRGRFDSDKNREKLLAILQEV